MKIRITHPAAIKFVSLLAGWVLRLWLGTMQFRFVVEDDRAIPSRLGCRGLYMFWHEALLFPAYTHARRGFAILVSTHRDGELIAQVVRMLRGSAIRGSTTRGGTRAVLGMMRDRRARHLAITPDGPRGPRRRVQGGAVYLASRGRMPLVPLGYASSHCWRAPSWDRMILPRPGQVVWCVAGPPIDIPADADREELERAGEQVQAAMDAVQDRADRLADGRERCVRWRPLADVV